MNLLKRPLDLFQLSQFCVLDECVLTTNQYMDQAWHAVEKPQPVKVKFKKTENRVKQ